LPEWIHALIRLSWFLRTAFSKNSVISEVFFIDLFQNPNPDKPEKTNNKSQKTKNIQ